MDQLQLFINDQLVDLTDDNPIALTFQINNLAEVKNQQGNTSNQFKLPLTQRNRQILGFPDDVAFTTNLPYQKYQAKLVQDGLEIIPYGIGVLNGIDQDTANITILSGNVDFFDAIDGKLYDMGDSTSIWSNYGQNLVWQPYDHLWNLDNVYYSQTYTDGWIYPVIDYGAIDATTFNNAIDVRYQRPGFFIKTAIELLLKSAGYKGTGSLLADPLYALLICQFSNGSWQHGTDIQNNTGIKSIAVETGLDVNVSHPTRFNNFGEIPFGIIDSDVSHCYNPGLNGYFVQEITSVTAAFEFSITFRSTNPSHIDYSSKIAVKISLYNDINTVVQNSTTLTETIINYADRGSLNYIFSKQTLSIDQVLQPGQGLKITYEFLGFTGSSFTLTAGAVFTVQNKVQDMQYGQMVQCERIFPDISQKDLLKDTLQRFGIICQTDNASKTISFNSFRDIVNNIPIAKDWTSKCLNQGKQVAFQLGNYAQINYMQYQNDDAVLPAKFGWSQINIADQTLPANATLFTSPFAATLNRPYYGGTIAQITMIDNKSDSMDFSIGVSPRILIDQKFDLRSINKTVTLTDGNGNSRIINDYISTPYFYKPDAPEPEKGYGPASLMFDDLRKKYYPELEKILTQTKKVVRYILLAPRDILELDLLIPVYIQQDSAYYYINKIDAWRKGQPTKVELVKLG